MNSCSLQLPQDERLAFNKMKWPQSLLLVSDGNSSSNLGLQHRAMIRGAHLQMLFCVHRML